MSKLVWNKILSNTPGLVGVDLCLKKQLWLQAWRNSSFTHTSLVIVFLSIKWKYYIGWYLILSPNLTLYYSIKAKWASVSLWKSLMADFTCENTQGWQWWQKPSCSNGLYMHLTFLEISLTRCIKKFKMTHTFIPSKTLSQESNLKWNKIYVYLF